MKCEYCGSDETVVGVLEGVSFVPESQFRKVLGSGLYGMNASLCRSCGRVGGFNFDPQVVSKEFKGK